MKEPLVSVAAGAFNWRLQPDFARELGPSGVHLEDWMRTGAATVVKQGPHRIVYRVQLASGAFYLKHNRAPDRKTRLRQWVRRSKACREYTAAIKTASLGIPTVQPLGFAKTRGLFGNGESMLITRSLDDTQPLNEFLHQVLPTFAARRQAQFRQRLASALGQFMARMHLAGIRYNDLHAGNLLLRLHADDTMELFLIDLNDIHFGACLTWRQSFDNLVILNIWFVLQAARSDRMRFLLGYLQARPLPAGMSLDPRDPLLRWWARRLETATWKALHKHWQRRDRRCLVDNRYYRRLSAPHAVGHTVADLDPQLGAALLADPDGPFRARDAIRLKDSSTSTVVEFTAQINGQAKQLIYKRFCLKKASTPWSSLFRMPPALRSWLQGQGFRERGLPTARPLLVLHRRRLGLMYEGYLLTEKIEAAIDLHGLVDRVSHAHSVECFRQHREAIRLVAQAVRELHKRQLSHRDLKAVNLLLGGSERDANADPGNTALTPSLLPCPLPGLWFLDLVGVAVHTHLSPRRRLQNLARLNASFHNRPELTRTDRLRFLRTYLQWNLLGKQSWKNWWRGVGEATETKLARNERAGRIVA